MNSRTPRSWLRRPKSWRLAAGLVLALLHSGPSLAADRSQAPSGSMLAPAPAALAIGMGLHLGVSVAGNQDLKLVRHDAAGQQTDLLLSADADEGVGPVVGAFATLFGTRGWTRYVGLQGEFLYWYSEVDARRLVDGRETGSSGDSPPNTTFDQHRIALMAMIVGRVPFHTSQQAGQAGSPDRSLIRSSRCWYFQGGIGIGPVYSKIEDGFRGWGYGFQLMAGVSLPLAEARRLRLDFRYFLAPEADPPAKTEWNVQVSGTPYYPYLAHHDTRFFMVTLGFEFGS